MAITLPLDKMTLAEKYEAFQMLWEDLCEQGKEIPVPAWQIEILREREAAVARGEEVPEDWETVKQELMDEFKCG